MPDQSPRLDDRIRAVLPPKGSEHDESCPKECGGGPCQCYRAPLVAAVRAVLDEHQPSVVSAGVRPGLFGAGNCAHCGKHPLVREYLNGPSTTPRHDHVDPYPQCQGCQEGSEDTGSWPCQTIGVIAVALGITKERAA